MVIVQLLWKIQIPSFSLGICQLEKITAIPLWAWAEWKMSASSQLQRGLHYAAAPLEEWKLILVFRCLYVNHGLSIVLLTMSEHMSFTSLPSSCLCSSL